MNEVELNPQLVYFHQRNAMAIATNLITFGIEQFVTTYRYQNLPVIRKICERLKPGTPPDLNLVKDLAFNQLIDSIKISICFENFLKALLLVNGYVIHKLDKDIFPDLSKEQYKKPVEFKNVKAIKDWEINPSIKTAIEGLNLQIKGIGDYTLGMKELLKSSYLSVTNIDLKIIEICKPYFVYRNNLHYYLSEYVSISKNDFDNFCLVIDFLNKDVIRIQNQMADSLGNSEGRKISVLIPNK